MVDRPAFVLWLIAPVVLVLLAYALARAASIGWYRTKLEYFRSMVKEGERQHGKD